MNDLLHIPLAFGGLLIFILDQYDKAISKYKEAFTWKTFWTRNWSGVAKNVICIFLMGWIAVLTEWEPSVEFSISIGYMGSALFKNRWLKKGTYTNGKEES